MDGDTHETLQNWTRRHTTDARSTTHNSLVVGSIPTWPTICDLVLWTKEHQTDTKENPIISGGPADVRGPTRAAIRVSRYDMLVVEIYQSAFKHGVTDRDIEHAVEYAMVAAEQDDGKVLYLGADLAGNVLEIVSVLRDDGTEVAIHAMRMRRIYEPLLHELGGTND